VRKAAPPPSSLVRYPFSLPSILVNDRFRLAGPKTKFPSFFLFDSHFPPIITYPQRGNISQENSYCTTPVGPPWKGCGKTFLIHIPFLMARRLPWVLEVFSKVPLISPHFTPPFRQPAGFRSGPFFSIEPSNDTCVGIICFALHAEFFFDNVKVPFFRRHRFLSKIDIGAFFPPPTPFPGVAPPPPTPLPCLFKFPSPPCAREITENRFSQHIGPPPLPPGTRFGLTMKERFPSPLSFFRLMDVGERPDQGFFPSTLPRYGIIFLQLTRDFPPRTFLPPLGSFAFLVLNKGGFVGGPPC